MLNVKAAFLYIYIYIYISIEKPAKVSFIDQPLLPKKGGTWSYKHTFKPQKFERDWNSKLLLVDLCCFIVIYFRKTILHYFLIYLLISICILEEAFK